MTKSSGWQLVPLGQVIASAQSGFASGARDPNGVIQMRMNNVTTDGNLDWTSFIRVPATPKQLAKYCLQPGDVLFNATNSPELVGKTTAFSGHAEPVVFSNHFVRLRVDDKRLDPWYLARWLTHQQQRRVFESLCTQWVNQASVRKDDLLSLRIPLPPLPEQKRIAAILAKADRLRRLRRFTRELSDTYLQSVFVHVFGDPGGNPKEWDVVPVEKVLSKDRAGTRTGPFGSSLKRHEYVEQGIPVWGIDNVRDNEFVEEGSLFITPSKYRALSRYTVEDGDILISRAGTVGRMCVAHPTQHPSIIGTNLVRVAVDTSTILPEYFTALFTYFAARIGRLSMSSGGTAYSFVNPRTLKSLEIPLSPLSLQQQFVRVVQQFERLRAQQREAGRQAEHLFQTLLRRAFRREL